MFGSKEEKMEKSLKKGEWDKIDKFYLHGNTETRLLLVSACGKTKCDISGNILGILLRDTDEKVQMAAVKTLGAIGSEHHVAELQQLMEKVPEDKIELLEAIHAAIKNVREKEY